MERNLEAKTIAEFLKKDLLGENIPIKGVCSIELIKSGCLMFTEHSTPEIWGRLSNLQDNLIICDEGMGGKHKWAKKLLLTTHG